ncbi:Electron transport complex subunit RsxB [Candidatus Hartigia pinicola]|nr:Electron transport complex subunit RsxB [Candidatus Hartigia pinicola]
MISLWIAIGILSIFGFIFGLILTYSSLQFIVDKKPIIEKLDMILPQNQCGQCNYLGCLPYAEAIVNTEEIINKCIPGGESVMLEIAELLNVEPQRITGDANTTNPVRQVALIDENNCIGCAKCVQKCPIDAIIGASRVMHTIIKDLCTGCNLCVTACPTNCIKLIPLKNNY